MVVTQNFVCDGGGLVLNEMPTSLRSYVQEKHNISCKKMLILNIFTALDSLISPDKLQSNCILKMQK